MQQTPLTNLIDYPEVGVHCISFDGTVQRIAPVEGIVR